MTAPNPGAICNSSAGHSFGEWRYSEDQAEAVRECARCSVLVARSGAIVREPAQSQLHAANGRANDSAKDSANDLDQTLDATVFAEELKGNFAVASADTDARFANIDELDDFLNASMQHATVCLARGDVLHATEYLDGVLAGSSGDADRALLALSYRMLAVHERYNTFPDGSGATAIDITARWDGTTDIAAFESQWQSAMAQSTQPAAQLESWIVASLVSTLKPARSFVGKIRYAPKDTARELLATAVGPAEQARQLGTTPAAPTLSAFAEFAIADLHRRAGAVDTAHTHLQHARDAYRSIGDKAGEALCLMTAADWTAAPFSTPLYWNFAVDDGGLAGNDLSVQLEHAEFSGGSQVSYDDAEALFADAAATRGLGAIALRRGYLAMLTDDWESAAAFAERAAEQFADAGDTRHLQLATTHRLLCILSGAQRADDTLAAARAIGAWGRQSGSYSYALALGLIITRLSRHWLTRRGHYERALACARAAQELFLDLGAEISACQCVVDQGTIHRAVGERALATTYFERALDEYAVLVERYPRVADNLRARLVTLGVTAYQVALDGTDVDAMERAALRLAQGMGAEHGVTVEQQLQGILSGVQAAMSGATQSAPVPGTTSAASSAQRELALNCIRQTAVLAPLYRSRAVRAFGNDAAVEALLSQATAAAAAMPPGERHLYEGIVLAERKNLPEAASAIRRYLSAGGANAGAAGELAALMQKLGGAHGAAEVKLQQRRTHEQGFAAFTAVRAWNDAREHLVALEQLAGSDWWATDLRPWEILSDIGETLEAGGDARGALARYDAAIELIESRRRLLSRDELKVALANRKGAQYLYFIAARAAFRVNDVERAFLYSERGKARALLDLLASSHSTALRGEHPDVHSWRNSRAQLRLTSDALARARAGGDGTRIQALDVEFKTR